MSRSASASPKLPGLLDDLGITAPAPARTPAVRRAREAISRPFVRAWAWVNGTPSRRRRFNRGAWGAGALIAAGAAVGAYFLLRTVPKPDYLNDDLDDVLGYTLLTEDFNRLPVDDRLAMIGQLIQRFKDMGQADSVLLAAFASGLAGAAREQMIENASRLAVDTWDKFAGEYAAVPEASQEQYLDDAFVKFTRMMEALGGQPRDIPDEERLADGKRQAERDLDRMRDPEKAPPGQALGRMFTFMNRDVGKFATSQQRVRGQQLMRDMTRRLRGQDIHTGRPIEKK